MFYIAFISILLRSFVCSNRIQEFIVQLDFGFFSCYAININLYVGI